MGKIYNDVDVEQNEDKNFKEMAKLLSDVSLAIEGRKDIKFRDAEINRLYNIMDKCDYKSAMLVGDFGSGKRSIIEGYVNKIQENVRPDQVIEVDFNEVIKKARESDFSKVIEDILFVATHNESFNITLVINNIGHLLNLNCYGNAGFSFINILTKYIEDGDLRVIVTVTNDEYKTIDDMFRRVLDFFTVIKVSELTEEQSREVIESDVEILEGNYDMKFPENVSEIICKNADKYIKTKVFPGKAEWLFDEVCSSIDHKYRPADPRLIELSKDTTKLKLDLQEASDVNDLKKINEINAQIDANIAEYNRLGQETYPTINVTESDILEAIGDIVGVQMKRLSEDQTKFLREMPDELKKKVIGQDEAIDMIVKNIRRNQLGLRKTAHSAGNFMFIGSTGVGKTFLAKQLAKYLYGSEENFLRLDMSEFQTEIDVTKLLGSAPGYVGYKESGLLVKGLAKTPDTVVLFDEIEKAHPKIYEVLLQLLDEGFITGSDGKKVDATKALIIFTSNIGVKEALSMSNPLGFSNKIDEKKNEKKEQIIRKALKSRFSPEWLNRLDNICYFNPLNRETLKSILYNELGEINESIKGITGKTVVLSQDVEKWILDKVEAEDNGARPIIRVLQQNIEELISDMVVNEDAALNTESETFTAELVEDKIILK